MKYKELRTTVITVLVLTIFFAGASLSFAAKERARVTIKDFGVEEPAILPGNPFYTLKGFFSNLFEEKNVKYKLNGYAAELLKAEEVTTVRSRLFERTLEVYASALAEFIQKDQSFLSTKEITPTLKLHLRFMDDLSQILTKEESVAIVETAKKNLKTELEILLADSILEK